MVFVGKNVRARFGIPEGRVLPPLVGLIAWCALGISARFGIPEGRVFPLLVGVIAWCALGELLRSAGAQERACLAPDSRSRFLSFRDGSLRECPARGDIPGPNSLITGGASAREAQTPCSPMLGG